MVAAKMNRAGIRHLHNHAPDASGYVAMIAAHMGGFTYSLTLHGFGILSEPNRWRLADKLERALFAVCVSWHARSQAMLWTAAKHWSRFHVVHCGVNPDEIAVREHHGTGKTLLFVGRFDHVKGLPVLIDAVRILSERRPDVRLELVGDGPLRPELESLVQSFGLGERVTFHGYLSQRSIREVQAGSDVCVMTSFSEGIPVVLMEAMAAGLPVVAPRITGIPELVEDGVSGYLTIPGNVDDLVTKIEGLLDDPKRRTRFGQSGRRQVSESFCLKQEVSRLVAVFEASLAGDNVAVRPEPNPKDVKAYGDARTTFEIQSAQRR